MGKTKKKSAQNPNVVAKQSIDEIKSGSVQKNKNPKFKSTPADKTALINNLKMQNKNKLQNNKKELKGEQYSLKGKKNVSKNKLQNKSVSKEMKKKLEVDDSESEEDFEENFEEEEEKKKQTVERKGVKVSKDIESKIEEDNNDDFSSSFVTDDDDDDDGGEEEEEEDEDEEKKKQNVVLDILGKSLADESDEDDEDFEEEYKDDDNWVTDEEDAENENSKNKIAEEKSLTLEFDDDDDDEDDSDDSSDYSDSWISDNSEQEKMNVTDIKNLPDVKEGKYLFFPDGVVNRTTIKVLHLPKTMTEGRIRKKFKEFGFIVNIYLKTEKENQCNVKCKNRPSTEVSAFVEYNCPISARRAFSMHKKEFGGNIIHVQYMENPNLLPIFDSSKCVWLSQLSFGIDTNSIWKKFRKCGEIECVKVFRNPHTKFTSGFGYVVFTTNKAVKKALKLNETILLGREMKVRARYVEENKEDELVESKELKKNAETLQHETNDNPSKKFKNTSGEAVARKAGNEKQQISQKSSVGLVEKKPTLYQSQKALAKQKRKKLRKELRQLSKKIATKHEHIKI